MKDYIVGHGTGISCEIGAYSRPSHPAPKTCGKRLAAYLDRHVIAAWLLCLVGMPFIALLTVFLAASAFGLLLMAVL